MNRLRAWTRMRALKTSASPSALTLTESHALYQDASV
jgi:hypothetical protein